MARKGLHSRAFHRAVNRLLKHGCSRKTERGASTYSYHCYLNENPENLGLRQSLQWEPHHGFRLYEHKNMRNRSQDTRMGLEVDQREQTGGNLPPVCDPLPLSWCSSPCLVPSWWHRLPCPTTHRPRVRDCMWRCLVRGARAHGGQFASSMEKAKASSLCLL